MHTEPENYSTPQNIRSFGRVMIQFHQALNTIHFIFYFRLPWFNVTLPPLVPFKWKDLTTADVTVDVTTAEQNTVDLTTEFTENVTIHNLPYANYTKQKIDLDLK